MHSHYDIPGLSGALLNVALGLIIMGYLVIAGQFWIARKADLRAIGPVDPERAAAALAKLIGIFVFCSVCGYLPRLILFPDWLMVATHLALTGFTWSYILSRQAVVIAAALARG